MKAVKTEPSNAGVIVFVSNSCWSIYNFRLEVIRHFLHQGHEVHVIANQDNFAVKLMDAGCRVHHVQFNNRDKNPLSNLQLYLQLKKLYKTIGPQLIFHYVIQPNIYGSLAARKLHIPSVAVVTGLGYAFSKENWLFKIVCSLYRFALKKTTEVWFLNSEDAELFIKKDLAPRHKIKILHSEGVDTERFKKKVDQNPGTHNRPFVFLMLTRMLWSKGVGVFATAASLLKKKGYTFECRVMGFFEAHHPDTISLDDLQRWKDEDTFIYNGFAQDVLPHLYEADCFVLPTFYKEGVPRSLLEAACVELPVITTNNTGCREAVNDGVSGFLCNANDAADLAGKMEQVILMNKDERNKMGREGRRLAVEKFDMKIIIAAYEETVNKFL